LSKIFEKYKNVPQFTFRAVNKLICRKNGLIGIVTLSKKEKYTKKFVRAEEVDYF
jgi:hypothetical protein